MDMITAQDVIRAMEGYFEGGISSYLSREMAEFVKPHTSYKTV